jgi:hypothetical protein
VATATATGTATDEAGRRRRSRVALYRVTQARPPRGPGLFVVAPARGAPRAAPDAQPASGSSAAAAAPA